MLARFRQETDASKKQQLLHVFTNLLSEEEWLQMIEQMLTEDGVLDTPFMRRQRMWRQEGWQEGMQEGIQTGMQKGMQKGVQAGEQKLLTHLLEKRFGKLPAWVSQKLTQATPEQLEHWSLQLLEAKQLEHVFTEPKAEK